MGTCDTWFQRALWSLKHHVSCSTWNIWHANRNHESINVWSHGAARPNLFYKIVCHYMTYYLIFSLSLADQQMIIHITFIVFFFFYCSITLFYHTEVHSEGPHQQQTPDSPAHFRRNCQINKPGHNLNIKTALQLYLCQDIFGQF